MGREGVLTGKQFQLRKPTVAIHLVNGTRTVVSLPANAVVRILSGPNGNGKVLDKGVVYATCEDQTVALFAVDLETRGIEIKESGQSPAGSA